jgi:hypothetical protein
MLPQAQKIYIGERGYTSIRLKRPSPIFFTKIAISTGNFYSKSNMIRTTKYVKSKPQIIGKLKIYVIVTFSRHAYNFLSFLSKVSPF